VRLLPLALAALVAGLAFAACNDDDDPGLAPTPGATEPAGSPPAATPTPEDVPDVVAEGYEKVRAYPTVNFNRMIGMFQEPGAGRNVLVLIQNGQVYRADLDVPEPEPELFLDVSASLRSPLSNEEGLLGLAFAPDYETSGDFYIMYTAPAPRRNVLSRFTTTGGIADPASETVVMEIEQPAGNHNGGALAFGPDGYVYIALGDGGSATAQSAQNTDNVYGSILRIDVDGDPYDIPADNPFAAGGGAPEIYAYGFRNPWRMTFDIETGDLWSADVGQDRWEEVNRVERGGNYGWPIMEGPECYQADTCPMEGLEMPLAWYPTGADCAIIGGYVYRGEALPELDGWYIYGDWCSGRIWALDTAEDGAEPVVLVPSGERIASFGQVDGEVYVVGYDGALFALERS
jgi:glucose/arabinose dehydrogenase